MPRAWSHSVLVLKPSPVLNHPGPEATPYESGVFSLTIKFPADFPFKAPDVKFVTQVYHPNVTPTGAVCLNILKEDWNPAMTVAKVLMSIRALLADPNPDHSLVPEVAAQFKADRAAFEKTAREWTAKYAK